MALKSSHLELCSARYLHLNESRSGWHMPRRARPTSWRATPIVGLKITPLELKPGVPCPKYQVARPLWHLGFTNLACHAHTTKWHALFETWLHNLACQAQSSMWHAHVKFFNLLCWNVSWHATPIASSGMPSFICYFLLFLLLFSPEIQHKAISKQCTNIYHLVHEIALINEIMLFLWSF